MKKVLILEDNRTTSRHISKIIQELDVKCKVYCFDKTKDAYEYVLENMIDLFIVDIILDTSKPGDSSGLKFVESIRKIEWYEFAPVIFVTSLEDSKLYSYEQLHCYNFIEKPFDTNKLKKIIEKCLRFPAYKKEEKTLYFRKDGIILSVESDDIVYAECNNHIIYIHTKERDTMSVPYITLKKLISELEGLNFIQCSRNTIINKHFIHNIDITNRIIQLKDNYGSLEIGIMYKKCMKENFK